MDGEMCSRIPVTSRNKHVQEVCYAALDHAQDYDFAAERLGRVSPMASPTKLTPSRSQVISQVLAEVRHAQATRLAEEGYRFYAAEATKFAKPQPGWQPRHWRALDSRGE